MSICITADLHLNDLARDQYRHDWMQNILPELLRKHKAKLLIILGDISDEKDHLSSWLVNQTVEHLTTLAQICPIIINKGNHDYIQSDCAFYEFLGKIPGITWIGQPIHAEQILIDERVYANKILGDALFLPHTSNYKRDWATFYSFEQDLFLTHQTFQGASVGPRKMDGIPTSIFPKDSLVISGDIHYPQEFDQIVYCGSPYACNFGDSFEPRVLLLDPVKLVYKSIPSPGPQKHLLELGYPYQHIERKLFESLWTDYIKCKANPGDILKVRVHIEPAQAPQWSAIKDEIHKWGEDRGYNIYLIQPLIDKTESGSMAKRKTVTRTDEQLVEYHVKSKSASEATLKTGANLMRRV